MFFVYCVQVEDYAYSPHVLAEVMRWRPAIPLGLEHTTTEDLHINVEGKTYMIPKGASLWGNVSFYSGSAFHSLLTFSF